MSTELRAVGEEPGVTCDREATPTLRVENVSIAFDRDDGPRTVVQSASFEIRRGEIVGIVGESGSGKTLLARAIMGLLPAGARLAQGSIHFEGRDLARLTPNERRDLRGKRMALVFQEPMAALNPAMRIGRQIAEVLSTHTSLGEKEIRERVVAMLGRVAIAEPDACLRRFPHTFSGGMRQRLMIASALLMRPALLIADEPTTALDCLVQKQVLELLLQLVRESGTSLLFISQDLGLVAQFASRVVVMERGHIVEQGEVRKVLLEPSHPYTIRLLDSLPVSTGRETGSPKESAPLVRIESLSVHYKLPRRFPFERQRTHAAVDGLTLDVRRGETLAVVGESGSGKTTLARAVLGLVRPTGGAIDLDGYSMDSQRPADFKSVSRVARLIFQDPYAALSPRRRIGEIVAEPLINIPGTTRTTRRERAAQALADVGLDAGFLERYPNQLSGGQRQRVSIATALIAGPRLIVADEPVSSLDVTVQAQVLSLFEHLQRKHGFSLLLISHDLAVVEKVADRVAVLLRGKLVELATCHQLFSNPQHPYTRSLLSALPALRRRESGGYELWKPDFSVPHSRR